MLRHDDVFLGVKPGRVWGGTAYNPQFDDVAGISLVSVVKIRFRKADGERDGREQWIRASKVLKPRSVYIMTGASRGVWEHSVPPVKTLRYSVMFRTLAPGPITLLDDSTSDKTSEVSRRNVT